MSTLKECLSTIFGALSLEGLFGECDNFDEEFKIVKKSYFSAARKSHPDKGGDAAVFRELHTAFEVCSSVV